MNALSYFTPEDKERIRQAVQSAEKVTSGEIRVYIEDRCKEDVMDHAAFIFEELKMQKTRLRNGVLIYVALHDHKFAVIGDAGIHAVTGDDFWNSVKAHMQLHFSEKKFTDGIVAAVNEAGKMLSRHFPASGENSNELPDEVHIS